MEYVCYVLIILIVFLLVYWPKMTEQKKLRKMQEGLKVGDKVITYSGLSGIIERMEEDKVVLNTNPDEVKLTIEKWSIAGMENEI